MDMDWVDMFAEFGTLNYTVLFVYLAARVVLGLVLGKVLSCRNAPEGTTIGFVRDN